MYSPAPFRTMIITLTLLIVLLLQGCGDQPPLRIGFVGELSGRRSEVAVSVRNAVQLKIDQINAAGGIKGTPLALVPIDNEGDTVKTEAIISGMIDDGIRFIVGPILSQQAEAAATAVAGRDVLLITPTMSTDFLTGKDDNILRTSSTTAKQGVQLGEYAQKSGAKNFAVVYDLSNRKYTQQLYEAFEQEIMGRGQAVTLVLTIDNTNEQEMLPLAGKIMDSGADGVLMCLAAVDSANLAQQLRKLGSKASFFGVSWSQTDDLILHGGRAVEGMVLVSTRNYGAPSPRQTRFQTEYAERYKAEPSFAGAKGYDAMGLLVQGMKNAHEITPTAVKKAILDIKDYPGAEKEITLDRFGDTLRGYNFVIVKDGRYIHAE